jgi:DNA polymerase-1
VNKLFWDTETALIAQGLAAPPLACLSYETFDARGLLHWTEAVPFFERHLRDESVLFVGHHVAYDFAVMAAHEPRLLPLIFKAYKENRVTDTMLRMKLLDISVGHFRGYDQEIENEKTGKISSVFRKFDYNLDFCYRRATKGKDALDKDTWRLRYGELIPVPMAEWPEGAKHYSQKDATATRVVYEFEEWYEQQVIKQYLALENRHIHNPEPLADQFRQARAAFWIELMAVWGIRTNPDFVGTLEEEVIEYEAKLQKILEDEGLVRSDGSRIMAAVEHRMRIACESAGREPRKTDKGNIKTSEEACKETGDPILLAYADYNSLSAVQSKDVPLLLEGREMPIHARFESIVATGRTSCSKPNIQNIRRLPGIRECFVPRPGKVFIDADYDGLELRTLAQVCMSWLGKSALADVLNKGDDPHLSVASTILHRPYSDIKSRKKEPDVFNARQLGKAANFGFAGGLGYTSFVSYAKMSGVIITEEEAKELKVNWMKTFPEMKDYFALIDSWTREMSREENPDGCLAIEHLFSKRLRGDCFYTVGCNSPFQGLGADATKAAGFLIAEECYIKKDSPLFGSRIVNYIHDQFLVETDDVPEAHDAAMRLAELMCIGAAPFLPDVPATVKEPLLARSWSKNAEQVWLEGRLVPWEKPYEVKFREAAHA